MNDPILLAGDIGGTKTRLGIFSREQGPFKPLAACTYSSTSHGGLEDIVRAFLLDTGYTVKRACFGVAGPVKDNAATITNLPWLIDGNTLAQEVGIDEVCLLNDLEAMAHAVPLLSGTSMEVVSPGEAEAQGVKALVAPGTGLGEVFLSWNGSKYRAHRSEGGHTEFGPRTDIESELLSYLRHRYDHVSYERVCSGMAIPDLYAFFRDTGRYPEPPGLAEQLKRADDPTPLIIEAALCFPEKNPICVAVVELFVSVLGAEAGNLALTVSAYGGIYIGGGIPPRIAHYIHSPLFIRTLKDKGRLSPMVSDIPVYLITLDDTALTGAASYGLP
ncbi:glucokinase [Desulfogranum mediterraneum]|uniref:glucokinase n=1 Tax=Desulfogranum mediterraneum TaxID=160661 RepID=UPI000408B688|nr:glucokinase [Desulfogranum mediterraneum]